MQEGHNRYEHSDSITVAPNNTDNTKNQIISKIIDSEEIKKLLKAIDEEIKVRSMNTAEKVGTGIGTTIGIVSPAPLALYAFRWTGDSALGRTLTFEHLAGRIAITILSYLSSSALSIAFNTRLYQKVCNAISKGDFSLGFNGRDGALYNSNTRTFGKIVHFYFLFVQTIFSAAIAPYLAYAVATELATAHWQIILATALAVPSPPGSNCVANIQIENEFLNFLSRRLERDRDSERKALIGDMQYLATVFGNQLKGGKKVINAEALFKLWNSFYHPTKKKGVEAIKNHALTKLLAIANILKKKHPLPEPTSFEKLKQIVIKGTKYAAKGISIPFMGAAVTPYLTKGREVGLAMAGSEGLGYFIGAMGLATNWGINTIASFKIVEDYEIGPQTLAVAIPSSTSALYQVDVAQTDPEKHFGPEYAQMEPVLVAGGVIVLALFSFDNILKRYALNQLSKNLELEKLAKQYSKDINAFRKLDINEQKRIKAYMLTMLIDKIVNTIIPTLNRISYKTIQGLHGIAYPEEYVNSHDNSADIKISDFNHDSSQVNISIDDLPEDSKRDQTSDSWQKPSQYSPAQLTTQHSTVFKNAIANNQQQTENNQYSVKEDTPLLQIPKKTQQQKFCTIM